MRTLACLLLSAAVATADDTVELAGMKAPKPKDWKHVEQPANSMRQATYSLPKADGDKEDGDLAVFFFKGGAGTLDQNLKRQRDKFLPADGKDKVDEKLTDVKIGTNEAKYQDLSGTFKKKPFPMAEKFTPMKEYRQIYVVFDGKEGSYYLNLLGPAKTIEKHKAAFDDLLKAFK
jgi:hypothetical protein